MSFAMRALRGPATLLAAASVLLGGCAAPRTAVTLMPDEDGHVGAVVVGSRAGSRPLQDAFGSVTVADAKSAPTAVRPGTEATLRQGHAAILDAQPGKPAVFVLHFVLDSSTLTEDSRALLPEMIRVARSRKPTEITVYGHADASGTDRHNEELSAERAHVVADLLRRSDKAFSDIAEEHFGARVPLVPGPGREPANRRVEVVIL